MDEYLTLSYRSIYFVPKLIISNSSGESSGFGTRLATSSIPSVASGTGTGTQSRRNSVSTAIDIEETDEDGTTQQLKTDDVHNDDTVHAGNGNVSTVSQGEEFRVRCRRCGYLDGEEESLLEEGTVTEVNKSDEEKSGEEKTSDEVKTD